MTNCLAFGQTGGLKTPAQSALEKLNAAQSAEKQAEIQGTIAGIGAVLEKRGVAIFVTNVVVAGPADLAGLAAGWAIASINGISAATMAVEDAVKLIRGPVGTEVTLKVIPPDGAPRELVLKREKMLLAPIKSKIVEGDLLWVHPTGFDKETAAAFRAILTARPANAKGILLDLRSSPGGHAGAMEEIAGVFLSKDSVLWSIRWANGGLEAVKKRVGLDECDLPVVVLINGRTLASELIASALQRNHRAILLGQPTSGFSVTNGLRELVNDPDGSSHYQFKGVFVLAEERANVVPDKVLDVAASEEDVFKAARMALAIAGAPSAAERLKKLKTLYEQGLIPKKDCDQKVTEIMNSL